MTLSAGTHLGPYEILSPLGAGGMGHVYRAERHGAGARRRAENPPHSFTHDPERLARCLWQARCTRAWGIPGFYIESWVKRDPGRSGNEVRVRT